MALTTEQRIQKTRVAILQDPEWRWMGGIVMMGETKIDVEERVTTAATDGLNEFYNSEFMAPLSDEQVKFIVLHENFHKMFRHLFVWKQLFEEDERIASIATDAVINNQNLIGKKGIAFVEGGVNMPEYADPEVWDARAIFEDLKKKQSSQGNSGGGASGQGSSKGGHDQHLYEDAKSMSKKEVESVQRSVDAALRQAAMIGAMAGGMPRNVQDMLVPPIDWRSELAEFVKTLMTGKDKQTWTKLHRTYLAYDIIMPDTYSERVGRILVGCDTSGSINDTMLNTFLGYTQQLCDEVSPAGVEIAWWDTKVAGVDVFEGDNLKNLANAVKPAGGGGTSPACVPKWLSKHPKRDEFVCAIMLTDGEFYSGDLGDWNGLPTIWVVVNPRDVPAIGVGKTIKVRNLE